MKLVWLTDLHFDTKPAWGVDLDARLTAAIDHVSAHQSDAAYCMVTGDLTNDGDRALNEALRARLDRLPMPWLPLVGNHDHRAHVRDVLDPPGMDGDCVQYAVETEEGVLLCLDTQREGSSVGEMPPARLDWLAARLAQYQGRPIFIFMHHPPARLHSQFDDIGLEDRAAFLDVLRGSRDVRHIFAGHIHRRASGVVAGVPFTTMQAVSFQAPGPGTVWDWNAFIPVKEPPAYGVIYIEGDDVTVQSELFCTADFGWTG
jgi:3',5'-cyclic AMP phosphodiesterase CpdA